MKTKQLKYENYCLQCGKKFRTHKSNIKVCSPKCALARKQEKDKSYWQKYYEENKEKILKKNRTWWKNNHPPFAEIKPKIEKQTLIKNCGICGEEFSTRNPLTKYCLLHRYRQFKAGIFTKACVVCGTEFLTKKKIRMCCANPDCKNKYKNDPQSYYIDF